MTKKKIIVFSLILVGLSLMASSAFALDPLVSCGLKDDPATEVDEGTPPCQTCDLLVLGKNISDFILFYLVPALAALAFIWAGFLILLGGGIPAQIAQGQNIFRTTVYGLAIIFLAWLIVNTTLRTVAGDDNIAENWWKLECQEADIPDSDKGGDEEGEVLTIKNEDFYDLTSTTVRIDWDTNKPATSQVDKGGGALTVLDQNKVYAHVVTLTGLNPNTEYRVKAVSIDDTGYKAESSVIIFKTKAGSGEGQFRFVTDEKLPDAVLNQNYSLQIAMDGGKPPYRLKLKSGSKLPEGLNMTAGGLISGKPTKLYEFGDGLNFTVEAEDSSNPPAPTQRLFTLKVVATASNTVISEVAHSNITTTGVTIIWKTDKPATSQVKYGTTSTLGAQSPLDSTLKTNHSVTLSGLQPNTNYNYRVYSRVTGYEAESTNRTFKTQDVATASLGITTGSLSDGAVGRTYNQTIQANGGKTPYSWSKSGNFPPGLNINASTGTITGMPTTAGNYTFTIRVQDATSPNPLSATRNFTVNIVQSGEVVTISEVARSNVTTTGATVTWKTDRGASSQVEYTNLTTGVKQSSAAQSGSRTGHSVILSGLISNTDYSVQAISVGATGFRAVSSPVTFKTVAGTPGTTSGTCTGVACRDSNLNICGQNTATNCLESGVNAWNPQIQAATSGKSICSGVNVVKMVKAIMSQESGGNISVSNGESVGLMQMKPSTANNYKSGCTTANIDAAWLKNPDNAQASICIAVNYLKSLSGTCGCNVRQIAAAYNGGPSACAASTSCASCSMCGTEPTRRWECLWDGPDGEHTSCNADRSSGSFGETRVYVPEVSYCYGKFSSTFPPPSGGLTISTNVLPAGTVNQSPGYAQTLQASGGKTPYRWTLAGGSLPPGLSLSASGVIAGQPTTAGTSIFTVKVEDSSSPKLNNTKQLSIKIDPQTTTGEACAAPSQLAQQHNEAYPAKRASELAVLLSCIADKTGQAVPAEGGANAFYGSLYTYDNSRPLCNYTRGDRHCLSYPEEKCGHKPNSCHYGGKTGTEGSLAVDLGNEANAGTINAAALSCGAKSARCENALGQNVGCAAGSGANHIHISSASCDAN